MSDLKLIAELYCTDIDATKKLQKPLGRGVNFQWDVIDLEKLYAGIQQKAPESIYLEMESMSYRCGNEVHIQNQFIAQDPDGYLFRFCSSGKQ